MPFVHQSASQPWPCFVSTSGAMYIGVPQIVYVRSPGSMIFASPKSMRLRYPSPSSSTFSSFRSR